MLEGHGGDMWKYGLPVKADFSSNVLYGELDAGLREHLCERVRSVTNYPEVDARTVGAMAAEAYGAVPGQVMVTNGATEAIYLVAQLFAGRSATVLVPAFAEYEDACRMHGMQIRIEKWGAPGAGGFGTDLVFVCNPNNPTGLTLPFNYLTGLAEEEPGVLFVIDESYIEFTEKTESVIARSGAASLLKAYPNVLVLRSLTKSCRIPGLRVGFVVGQEERIKQLHRLKMPWSVNQLALDAAQYIFRHPDRFVLPLAELLAATGAWREDLRAVTGWNVHDSDTHFFLMETPEDLGVEVLKRWLLKRGLLIRDASNFRGLGPRHFRLACQDREDNHELTEALRVCSRYGLGSFR